jgi:hypothetical protein
VHCGNAENRAAFPMCAAIGFNVETVSYKNIKFQVWDLGGQTSIRPYWRCYYPNTQVCNKGQQLVQGGMQQRTCCPTWHLPILLTQAIIYVVDSTDTERISVSKEEFHAILEEEELKDALILVYANKQVRDSRELAEAGCCRSICRVHRATAVQINLQTSACIFRPGSNSTLSSFCCCRTCQEPCRMHR